MFYVYIFTIYTHGKNKDCKSIFYYCNAQS